MTGRATWFATLCLPLAATAAGAPDMARLEAALRSADYVVLGEVHDNPRHHALHERLLSKLAGTRPMALVMEVFDVADQAAIDRARMLGHADAIAAAGNIPANRWNWASYRPKVEVALDAGWPLGAGNLSRAQARRVAGKEGFGALEGVEALGLEAAWNDGLERSLAKEIADAHCGLLPASAVPGMVRAQRARDALMADRMLRHPRAVLVAGNGHARHDRGVPAYLRVRAPHARIVTVGFLEEGNEAEAAAYDFAWITSRHARPDPCASFKPPAR